jgi:hypothetical protein
MVRPGTRASSNMTNQVRQSIDVNSNRMSNEAVLSADELAAISAGTNISNSGNGVGNRSSSVAFVAINNSGNGTGNTTRDA